jgi:hypothetical protein
VRISSASFSLTTPTECVPTKAEVALLTTYADLQRTRLTLIKRESNGPRSVVSYVLKVTPVEGESARFIATLSDEDRKLIAAAETTRKPQDHAWVATFEFSQLPSIDIQAVEVSYSPAFGALGCANERLTRDTLLSRLVGTSGRLMYFSLMQDKLSDVVFAVNEVIGNVLLCALLLAVFWLVHRVAAGWRLVYWVPDDVLRKLGGSQARTVLTRDDVLSDHRASIHSLGFLRVIGPAMGFLLTVSSLIAGLHPSATAAQDTFRFVASLQLALVATLLGLAMRVLAEFALRLHRDAAERKLKLIETAERMGDQP